MIKLFTGSSNPNLTQEVTKLLKILISKAEIIRFDNSEVKITIQEPVKDKVCVVLQSTSNPTDTNLMELLLFADALKRADAKKIVAFIPYFGYARQNREHRPGESVSANVVIRFIETVGYNEVYTFDIHDEGTEGIFSVPFKNLSALPLLAKNVKNYLTSTDLSVDLSLESRLRREKWEALAKADSVVVSPDQGGVERARLFAKHFYPHGSGEIVLIEKKRDLNTIHASQAMQLYGNVKNKTCILIDDIITSGKTLINAAEICLKKGAKKIIAVVTHHDLSPSAPKRLQVSPIEKIFTTNTIFLKEDQRFTKLEELSIADLIANELKTL